MNSNIPLDQYRVFAEAAKSSSFSQAAQRLFVSQSAVSQSVKSLEQALGVSLFVRNKRGVSLTAEGKDLLQYVQSALRLLENGETHIGHMRQLLAGRLKISAGDTISRHVLLPCLEQFHAQYPHIALEVTNRTSTEAFSLIKSGAVDLAFVNTPLQDEELCYQTVLRVQDVFIAGPKYAHLRNKTITRRELLDYPLIMLEQLSNSRRSIDRDFLRDGLRLSPAIELGAHDLLMEFVKIGLGICCVTREFSGIGQQPDLFEITLERPLPSRYVALCWAQSLPLSPAARGFCSLVMERYAKSPL